MLPSGPCSGDDAPGARFGPPTRTSGATLPPPDWHPPRAPVPEGSRPLPRRVGVRAEEAWLRARVAEARARGDRGAAREACAALARWLASRDRDLDEAVALAFAALEMDSDADDEESGSDVVGARPTRRATGGAEGRFVELRRELAAWLESLGEAARAAAVLRPIATGSQTHPLEAADVLVRIGLLKARAGAAASAAAAFDAARAADPVDPVPAELLGAIATWQREATTLEVGVEAYLDAAQRRSAKGQVEGELENLWRAFTLGPDRPSVARALADALDRRARPGAADEVWRAHARALARSDPAAVAHVHARRQRAALQAGDSARALGAALDAQLRAGADDAEAGRAIDTILLGLGMLDVVTACRRLSLESDPRARAAALEAVAAGSTPIHAILLAIAAEHRLSGGDIAAAFEDAHRSLRLDPAGLRALAALADAAAAARGGAGRSVGAEASSDVERARESAELLQRAIALLGPRPSWCGALSELLESTGRRDLAVACAERAVLLLPGDRVAVDRLLDRLAETGDAARLGGVLSWLMGQPEATPWSTEALGRALATLGRLDIEGAMIIARRALDVLGPKAALLREAMLEVAGRAGDDRFAAALLERWLAAGARGADQGSILGRLIGLRRRLRDDDGVARTVARAVHAGLRLPEVDEYLSGTFEGGPGDALVWRLRAAADRAEAVREVSAGWALRDLGAALWDLADDRVGAISAWERAARLAAGGHAILTRDLVACAGLEFAFDYLTRVVQSEPDDDAAADLGAQVSRAALSLGEPDFAFDIAVTGLQRSPRAAGVLEAAERAAGRPADRAVLSGHYDGIAGRAYGAFGRRAAHYRAARFFERSGDFGLALSHAVGAFAALPSEGSTLQLMLRVASAASARSEAAGAIEQVAVLESNKSLRAAWLVRAAEIVGDDQEGARRRLDLLLRAAAASPSLDILSALAVAARDLSSRAVDEREGLELRVLHAARAITARVDGPHGARVAVAFARIALEVLDDADAALECVGKALAYDADVDDFEALRPRTRELARATAIRAWLGDWQARFERTSSAIGDAARALLQDLTAAVADVASAAPHTIDVVAPAPTDDALVDSSHAAPPNLADIKRLAREQERDGGAGEAEALWRQVANLDPDDDDADLALEQLLSNRGDYLELAAHLARRCDRLRRGPVDDEILRAVRLRRAALLEQRLGRTREACAELLRLLEEWPDQPAALRYLADLFERQGDFFRAAPLWRRAAALEPSAMERDQLELRAARAWLEAGDPGVAREHALRVIQRSPTHRGAHEVRLSAARALGSPGEIGDALDVAAAGEPDPAVRAPMLFESAQAALRCGDSLRALDRARRAAADAPTRADLCLFFHELAYRARGAGAPDEARRAIDDLSRMSTPLPPDDTALRAFLLAEALDAVQGGGAGLRELEATRVAIGTHPVIALGLAERLAAQGDYPGAVAAYRIALAGPLRDLRRPALVALAGAESACRASNAADASFFLERTVAHEEVREAAALLRARVTELANPVISVAEVRLYDLEAAVQAATNPQERARARVALARGRLDLGDVRGAEPLLWEALADGLVEAGEVLARLLSRSPDRAAELVRLRWHEVLLDPGSLSRLEALRAAALADGDAAHARAVEHVLRAFDAGAGPLPPAPLAAQPEQPGMLSLLARPALDAAGETFALVWDGASQLFARDPTSYGITGIERVEAGPASALSRAYEAALRSLDAPRIPLFASRQAAGTVSSQAALLVPASAILSGDLRVETPALRFELGRGLSAALPQNVLRCGLSAAEGTVVVEAVRMAFGPPELGRRVDSQAARLAESFWQIIPARSQRRLQELLRLSPLADYAKLVEASRQSGRRVGMFVSGDFAWAVRSALAEDGEVPRALAPESLPDLCAKRPTVADLLALAVQREYAAARWNAAPPPSSRRNPSSGGVRLL